MRKIDLHQDIILSFQENSAWFDDRAFTTSCAWGYADYIASDLRIVFAAFWPYQVSGELRDLENRKIEYDKNLFDSQYQAMYRLIQQNNLRVIRLREDIDNISSLSVLLHIEWIDHEVTREEISKYFQKGIRSIGLVWNVDNHLAESNISSAWTGLTELGKEIIQEMNALGIIIDTAHMSHASMMQTVALSTKPILNSHANLKHFCAHTRNVEDAFLYALKENGGVLWLSVYTPFIWSSRVEDYLDQIARVIELIWPDHIALGTDFHGIPPEKCLQWVCHITDLTYLEEKVTERFGKEIATKFFWENSRRLILQNLPR
jgi:microsomal dipeptidase-like Zn-dependent dipeptidase